MLINAIQFIAILTNWHKKKISIPWESEENKLRRIKNLLLTQNLSKRKLSVKWKKKIYSEYTKKLFNFKTVCVCVCVVVLKCSTMVQKTGVQIPGSVIPKTQKTVLDASLLNTQHSKVWIKGKWINPGKSNTLIYLGIVGLGAF